MPKTFECLACGAPVTAEPGEEVMPCPYCGAALTIPPRLRRKRSPQTTSAPPRPRNPFSAAASVRLDEKTLERRQRESEMLTNETVEKPFFAGRNTRSAPGSPLLGDRITLDGPIHAPGGYWSAPKAWIFPILCTSANNLHCTSTLDFERKVNRFMCL